MSSFSYIHAHTKIHIKLKKILLFSISFFYFLYFFSFQHTHTHHIQCVRRGMHMFQALLILNKEMEINTQIGMSCLPKYQESAQTLANRRCFVTSLEYVNGRYSKKISLIVSNGIYKSQFLSHSPPSFCFLSLFIFMYFFRIFWLKPFIVFLILILFLSLSLPLSSKG